MSFLAKLFRAVSQTATWAGQAAEEFVRTVDRSAALQSATSELGLHVDQQKAIIEAALQTAIRWEEINALSPERRQAFNESYTELMAALERAEAGDEPPTPASPRPSFALPSHENPEIQAAIREKVGRMREEHEAFLSAVHMKLAESPSLRSEFIRQLQELKADHYLVDLGLRSD